MTMKETDWTKTLEVVVKGLVAVVVGLAAFYVLGWILSFIGGILLGLAGIIVALLRWLVPVAIIVGVVYFAVTRLQQKPIVTASSSTPIPSEPKEVVVETAKVVEVESKIEDKVEKAVEEVAAKTDLGKD